MFQVTQNHETVISRVRCDRGARSKEVRAVSELVVEVGSGISDDTNGEVETGDGLGCDIIRCWRKGTNGGYRAGRAELTTVEEEKKTKILISPSQG